MKIAANAYFLAGKRAGIGNYSWQVIKGLSKLYKEDQFLKIDNRYHLNKMLFEQVYLPALLFWRRPALFYSPSMVLPLLNMIPSIMVVYDLVFKIHPEYYRGHLNLWYLKVFFERSLFQSKKIIAISESTKKDLVSLYGVPEEKISVIHLAAGPNFCIIDKQDKLDAIRRRYQLPDEYILFVGTIEPRKNVQGLIAAYRQLSSELRNKYHLVLCGQQGWGRDWQNEGDGAVRFLDYVRGDDLPAIYNLASLFVYPSFYEGFGLPVLEAMACGVPTITSNVSSLPEVAGDAAMLVDPHNVAEMSKTISLVLTDSQLCAGMKEKGISRAKQFSWDHTVMETREVIEAIINKEG